MKRKPLRHTELTRAFEAVVRDAKYLVAPFPDVAWFKRSSGGIARLVRSVARLRKLEGKRG